MTISKGGRVKLTTWDWPLWYLWNHTAWPLCGGWSVPLWLRILLAVQRRPVRRSPRRSQW